MPPTIQQSDATVASAIARNVPVVSAKQMLDWLDGRNGSSFGSIAWSAGTLTFTIEAAAGANGLTAMVPSHAKGGVLTGLTRDGAAVDLRRAVREGGRVRVLCRGVRQLRRDLRRGRHAAGDLRRHRDAWRGRHGGDHMDDGRAGGLSRGLRHLAVGADQRRRAAALPVTSHAVTLAGLAPSTTYYFRVTSTDGAGNAATTAIGSFTMPATHVRRDRHDGGRLRRRHARRPGRTSRRPPTAKSS